MQPNSSDRSPFFFKVRAKRVSIYWTFPGFSRNRPRAKTSREKDFTLTRHMKTFFFAQMIAICFSATHARCGLAFSRSHWKLNEHIMSYNALSFSPSMLFWERILWESFSFKLNLTWISQKYWKRIAWSRPLWSISLRNYESVITWLKLDLRWESELRSKSDRVNCDLTKKLWMKLLLTGAEWSIFEITKPT